MIKKFRTKDSDFKLSKWSKNNPKTCVAVAIKKEGVAVRNSNDELKNTLFFSHAEWKAFVMGVKRMNLTFLSSSILALFLKKARIF